MKSWETSFLALEYLKRPVTTPKIGNNLSPVIQNAKYYKLLAIDRSIKVFLKYLKETKKHFAIIVQPLHTNELSGMPSVVQGACFTGVLRSFTQTKLPISPSNTEHEGR